MGGAYVKSKGVGDWGFDVRFRFASDIRKLRASGRKPGRQLCANVSYCRRCFLMSKICSNPMVGEVACLWSCQVVICRVCERLRMEKENGWDPYRWWAPHVKTKYQAASGYIAPCRGRLRRDSFVVCPSQHMHGKAVTRIMSRAHQVTALLVITHDLRRSYI